MRHNRHCYFAIGIVCLLTFYHSQLLAQENTQQTFADKPIKARDGYLVFKLDVEVDNARMQLIPIRWSSKAPVYYPLVADEHGYFRIQLRAGDYKVTELHTPYFNLPYILDTESTSTWQFHVEKQRINYAGELIIKKERTLKTVDVNLLNRFAMHSEEFCETHMGLCEQYPFATAAIYRDDFPGQIETLKHDQ